MKNEEKKLAFEFLMEDTNERGLEIICFSEDSGIIIARSKRNGKAHYLYVVSEDCTCDYSLLSEIGQPFKKPFEKLMRENNLIPTIKETDKDYFETF